MQAIENAGYRLGEGIAIAIDSAATSLYSEEAGAYELKWSNRGTKSTDEMIALATAWTNKYPIVL